MIEKKDASIVWHFRLADSAYGMWQARECQNHIADSVENFYPIHAVLNSKNIEVRPRSISKTKVANYILADIEETEKIVFCIGNERADEEIFGLFKELQAKDVTSKYVSCSVGSKPIGADYFTSGVLETLHLLKRLAENK